MKRIVLFLATNIAVVLVLSIILKVLGLDRAGYAGASYGQLLVFSAVVGFTGRTERIARVHHFGLRDSVKPGGPEYDYPARPLLGISDDFTKRLQDRLLSHLAGG